MANDAGPDNGASRNEQIIRAFARQFDPPLAVCRTDRINNARVRDGWTCAWWANGRGLGVTCVVMGNQILHAFIEAAGESDPEDSAMVGRIMAQALGRTKEARGNE